MKFYIRFFSIFVIVSLFLFTYKSNAEEMQVCPQGCFCIYDGKLPKRISLTNVCGNGYVAQRMYCNDSNKVVGFAYAGGAYEGKLSCTRDKQAEYYFDEFYELYITQHGMYGFLGQDLITMPFFGLEGYGSTVGVYQCPSSYPTSSAGAKTVFDCYKYENGQKVYYTNPQNKMIERYSKIVKKIFGIRSPSNKSLVDNLKTATDKSKSPSGGDLKTATDKPKSPSGVDLETAKKMISVGI